MNKEIEKKWQGFCDDELDVDIYYHLPKIKTFIDTHFCAKKDIETVIDDLKKMAVLKTSRSGEVYCAGCWGQKNCQCDAHNQALQELKDKLI